MDFDVLIVGAGLAGGSLACALAASRLRVGVLEARPPSRATGWDARIYALSPANVDFLSELGIWQRLDPARANRVERMAVAGDAGGHLDFSAYESGLDALAWIVESSPLAVELWETLRRQPNVSVFCPAAPQRLEVDATRARVTLEDGRTLTAQLVVGADGAHSWVRQAAGLVAKLTPYGEQGVVANFACEYPHRDTAFQWFRRDGILAWLPLPEGHISMVWSCADTVAAELLALDADTLAKRVAEAGAHTLGALRRVTPPLGFPLHLTRLGTVVAPRVALVGDAAHTVHPLSGHGINLGLGDVRHLARVLGALPAHRNCGELPVLRRYARARAEDVALTQTLTHSLNRLFRPSNPLLAAIRNAGMNATTRLPLLKDALARHASGMF